MNACGMYTQYKTVTYGSEKFQNTQRGSVKFSTVTSKSIVTGVANPSTPLCMATWPDMTSEPVLMSSLDENTILSCLAS